jgi:nucleoid-associated protein YgaU
MLTPLTSARQRPDRAYLEIVHPKVKDAIIPLHFNPTEYQVQKANNFAEINIPGLESPPIQFVRGGAEKLTADLIVDTSDTLDDVRDRYVNKLRGLMNISKELHAPPIVRLMWSGQIFLGVIESLNITYTLFRPDGRPLRAKLALALKEYRPAAVQINERPTNSPDVEKSWTVRRGDTLASIAGALYRDCSQWRAIAAANAIVDPRRLDPGQTLAVPRLR